MKTIIFIFSFCLVGILAVSEESITKLRKIESVCAEENGIDLQKADDVKKGIFDKNDEKLACYVDCMLKKVGFVNTDTTFNEEKFRERTTKLDSEQVNRLVNNCKDITESNSCKKSSKLLQCFIDNNLMKIFE
ncbi:general odorant-binding protein 56d-like [Apis dorsata]|uniref:general odorant-binding protein 56d-like n=1 Tax=Apis dorsata TaxID=7462 RepID=UPI0003DF52C6|nr:general odorant-binding protein 56d-like [Apis dorsata]